MLLRWLINHYVGPTARQHLQEAVAQSMRGSAQRRETSQGTEAEEELAPPCDIAVIFALGIESGGTADLLQQASVARVGSFTEHAGLLGGKEAVVVESGIGGTAAAQATADVIEFHQPRWVISAGFAGALDPAVRRGQIVMASEIVKDGLPSLSVGLKMDAKQVRGLHVGRLLTVDKLIRTQADKGALGRQHSAIACDMETYAIADVCRQRNVRFLSVRIISDGLEDELPKEVDRLLAQKSLAGKLGAAAQALLRRPSSALDLLKLQDDGLKASDRLARFLVSLLPQLGP